MRRIVIISALLIAELLAGADTRAQILTGAAQMDRYLPLLQGKRIGILTNYTAVVGKTHLVDTLLKKGITISKIFSPEHGFRGDADAGAKVGNQVDPATGIPIVSLYGHKNKPDPADLEDVDVMLYDIQDVGVRFYTYIGSMQRFMEAAIENHRPLIILDRPDPNGGYVDGPVLDTAYRSFVGMQPIPVEYGMTIGEYARMLVGEGWVKSDTGFRLVIIPCKRYTHHSDYLLPVKPSPNLPNMQSVRLYASFCLFEGTAISLGRGTDKPFQQFGAPALPKELYSFTPQSMPGATNPPYLGETCYGYDLSEVPVKGMKLQWVIQAYKLFPDKEHFFNRNGSGFDRLAGGPALRQEIIEGWTEAQMRKSWEPALEHFKDIRKKYLLYAD